MITFHCNFRCPYCFFKNNQSKEAYMYKQRGPRLPRNRLENYMFKLLFKIGIFKKADSFINYDLKKWITLFIELSKFRKNLYLSFTGGEPLLHYKKINIFLKEIEKYFQKLYVRIDTNGSIVPIFDEDIIRYIYYNISYHPSQINKNLLIKNLNYISKTGKILMINRVITEKDKVEEIRKEISEFKKLGYFLNINPSHFDIRNFSAEHKDFIKKIKADIDYECSLENKNIGRLCLYPTFGIQLLPNGYAWIPPCDLKNVIDLIHYPSNINKILKRRSIKCPNKCVCFHQYPWAFNGYETMNIMEEFVNRNITHREKIL